MQMMHGIWNEQSGYKYVVEGGFKMRKICYEYINRIFYWLEFITLSNINHIILIYYNKNLKMRNFLFYFSVGFYVAYSYYSKMIKLGNI